MLTLSLVTPSKKILTDQVVEEVFIPSFKGELNILEGHAPLMSTLDTGILKYRLAGEKQLEEIVISWGYLEVSKDHVTVLAETAEKASEIDLERAKLAKSKSEKALLAPDAEQAQFEKYQLKLQRSLVRLQLAEKADMPLDKKST